VIAFRERVRRPRVGFDCRGGAPRFRGGVRPAFGSRLMSGEDPSPTPTPSGPSASANGFVPGSVVAQKYVLSHELGSGGMGVVWAARHLQSGELVALKFLRAGEG